MSAPPMLYITSASGGKVGGALGFVLQDGFEDGYQSRIEGWAGTFFTTHPASFINKGGQVQPLRIVLDLAVGVWPIETPDKLTSTVEYLFALSLPLKSQGMIIPERVYVGVGAGGNTWFRRFGYINGVKVKWMPPYSTQGRPMRAEVNFELIADFGALRFEAGKTGQLPTHILDNLPNRSKWSWRFTGGNG